MMPFLQTQHYQNGLDNITSPHYNFLLRAGEVT